MSRKESKAAPEGNDPIPQVAYVMPGGINYTRGLPTSNVGIVGQEIG